MILPLPRVPRLHFIGPLDVVTLEEYVEIAVAASSACPLGVHLRTPEIGAEEMLTAARELRARLASHSTLIVNDRVDVAVLAGADGVQLGERSLTVNHARLLVGDRLIGRSIHDAAGARNAEADGASFVLAGNTFATPSKPGMDGQGTTWLAQMAGAIAIPVIALGGITVERIPAVMSACVWGVAMGRELLRAGDPASVAEDAHDQILESLKEREHAAHR